jgi:hypothetical protein
MDGMVDALRTVPVRPGRNDVREKLTNATGTGRCKLLVTHISRSPRHALAAPSDARCTRSDSSAFREGLAGRRLSG